MRLLHLLLSVSGCLLAFPASGFSPASFSSSSRTVVQSMPSSKQPAAATTAHYQPRRAGGVPTTSSSATQLSFTPKTDEADDDDDDKPAFIRPALHNSPFFRSLAILYALLFAVYQTSSSSSPSTTLASSANDALLRRMGKYLILPPSAAATVHLLSFATWFGTVVYTTFVAGITMFKNLPRRVFGTLQSKLFPLYFRLCSATVAMQILTLTAMPDVLGKTSEVSLAVAFFATLLNLLYLEPKSTRVMFDRYALEDEGRRESEEYKEKAKAFGMLHGVSSLTNLVALCAGVVHGARLASKLSGGLGA